MFREMLQSTFGSHRVSHPASRKSGGSSARNWPAVVANDLFEFGFVLAVVRVAQHVLIVTVVRQVAVLGDQMHVEDADVDAQAGLAVPVEVRRLRGVRDVVGRLEVPRAVEILGEHVAGSLDFHL